MIFPKNKLLLIISLLSTFLLVPSFVCGSALVMKSYIRTIYPDDIKTKRDLIKYIIQGTGYQLYVGKNAPVDARYILSQTPNYQRKDVLMSRTDALLMAVGENNSIVIDHNRMFVSVTRSPLNDLP